MPNPIGVGELEDVTTLLTLLTAVASEARRTATLSRDMVAGRALRTVAALQAALAISTRKTR